MLPPEVSTVVVWGPNGVTTPGCAKNPRIGASQRRIAGKYCLELPGEPEPSECSHPPAPAPTTESQPLTTCCCGHKAGTKKASAETLAAKRNNLADLANWTDSFMRLATLFKSI